MTPDRCLMGFKYGVSALVSRKFSDCDDRKVESERARFLNCKACNYSCCGLHCQLLCSVVCWVCCAEVYSIAEAAHADFFHSELVPNPCHASSYLLQLQIFLGKDERKGPTPLPSRKFTSRPFEKQSSTAFHSAPIPFLSQPPLLLPKSCVVASLLFFQISLHSKYCQ